MNKLRIWHISDTHCKHDELIVPKDIDMVIHSGDFSNNKVPGFNDPEVFNFINWYYKLPIKYKILVAGNHDTSVEAGYWKKDNFENYNIMYLGHESVEVEGIKIFGSPYTPEFNQWAFNVKREKLFKYWESIPLDTNILVTHGPPLSILDNDLGIQLGCRSLNKRIKKLKDLRIHQFGHIHSRKRKQQIYINRGIFQEYEGSTKFINACCTDLDYEIEMGNIITEMEIG